MFSGFCLRPPLSPTHRQVLSLQSTNYRHMFYYSQILTIKDPNNETYDERQGKMLLHTEVTLLSLLNDQTGVVHSHDFFQVSLHAVWHFRLWSIMY